MLSAFPAWLASNSDSTWDASTHVLNVAGPTTITANPGPDAPLVIASGTNAALSIAPSSDSLIQLGGLALSGGASAEVIRPNAGSFDASSSVVVAIGFSGGNGPALSIDSSNGSTLGLEDNHLLVRGGIAGESDYILGLAVQSPGMSSPETLSPSDYAQDATPIAQSSAAEQLTVAGQGLPVAGGDLLVGFDALPATAQPSSAQAMDAGPAVPAGFFAAGGFTAQSSQQPAAPISGTTPAEVSSVVINGNDSTLVGPQRSMVKNILYTFSEPVTLGANAFSMAIASGQTGTIPTLSWSAVSPDGNGASAKWVVTFSGAGVVGGSIADGVYDVTLNTSAVTSEANPTVPAQPHNTDTFFRLFGDINGDGYVNAYDNARFRSALTTYNPAFDYNADGVIDATDSNAFNARVGTVSFTGLISFNPAALEPTSVSAAATSSTSVTISWTAPSGAAISGYRIQFWSVADSAWEPLVQNLPSTATSYTTATDPDTAYEYQVAAESGGRVSDWSTSSTDVTTAPATPAGLTATAVSTSEIDLSWTNSDPNPTGIQILRSTDGSTFTTLAQLDGYESSYADTGLTPNTHYWYEVIIDGPGGSSATATADASTPSTDAPSALTASGISTSQINLTWTNNSTTATGIEIDRSTDGVNFSPIATGLSPTATSYSDSGLQDDTKYWYAVKATGPSGNSSFSPAASAWTIPGAPSGLLASVPSAYEVDLAWTNNSVNSPEFQIQRSTDGVNFTTIDTTDAGATTYQDLSVTDNTTYTYRVVAAGGDGSLSSASDQVTISTPLAILDNLTATGVSATQIDLAWTDNSGGTAPATIWRSTDDATWTQIATVAPGTTIFADGGLTPDSVYYYYLSTTGPSATAISNQAAGATLPTAPANLTATSVAGAQGDVQLAWTDTANDNDGYAIFESSDGSSFSEIAAVDNGTTTYDDVAAADGVTDYYEVKAFGLGGDSAPTTVVSVEPIATVQGIDDTPANDFSQQVVHGKSVTLSESSLLNNDTDANNNPALSMQSFTQPSHGTLTDNGDGSLTYTANGSYVGTDTFTYTPTDQYSAPGTPATVQIQVTDAMPEAYSSQIIVAEYQDAQGQWQLYPAPQSGTLTAQDGDGDSLTFSATKISGPGTFVYDSTTGAYTYTPSQSDQGQAVIVFTANDGALSSNKASLIFPGWKVTTVDDDDPDYDGDDIVAAENLPRATNQNFAVDQNGSLQVYASAGLLSTAVDEDGAPDSDSLSVDSGLIESPQHGSVTINDSDGSFIYTPTAGFSGRDYFTWRVDDGSKHGDYATAFIDVHPMPVTISVDNLKPGDTTAQIPNSQFPPDANGDPQYATIHLNYPTLPNGSTIKLSVNSDVQNDLDVYDGIPGQSGTNLLFGKDAGSDSYTWTVGGSPTPPSTVYAVGLAGTDYDQAVLTLSVAVAQQTVGVPPASPPPAPPAPQTQPINQTQPETQPGKHDYVVALDGTLDNAAAHTNIFRFAQQFSDEFRGYVKGVANPDTDPDWVGKAIDFPFGGKEMQEFVQEAETNVNTFYTEDKTHQDDVLDVVGYSRGAMEAVQVVNDLSTNGLPDVGLDVTRDGHVVTDFEAPWKPIVRFVGLISPFHGPKDAPRDGEWPENLPASVGPVFIASARKPIARAVKINEKIITKGPNLQPIPVKPYQLSHTEVGHLQVVLNGLMAAARDAKVIFKS